MYCLLQQAPPTLFPKAPRDDPNAGVGVFLFLSCKPEPIPLLYLATRSSEQDSSSRRNKCFGPATDQQQDKSQNNADPHHDQVREHAPVRNGGAAGLPGLRCARKQPFRGGSRTRGRVSLLLQGKQGLRKL